MACASEHCLVNASCDTNSEHFEILEQTESLSVSSYSSVSESEVVALRIKKREKLCFVPVSTKSGITPIPEDELNRMLMGNCDDRDPTPATDNSNALTDNHTQQPLNRGIRAEELNSCSQNENRNDARSENVLKRKRQGTDHFSPPLATKTFMKGKSTNKEHKRRKRIRWTKEMDSLLEKGVHELKTAGWKNVARFVGYGLTALQCQGRWRNLFPLATAPASTSTSTPQPKRKGRPPKQKYQSSPTADSLPTAILSAVDTCLLTSSPVPVPVPVPPVPVPPPEPAPQLKRRGRPRKHEKGNGRKTSSQLAEVTTADQHQAAAGLSRWSRQRDDRLLSMVHEHCSKHGECKDVDFVEVARSFNTEMGLAVSSSQCTDRYNLLVSRTTALAMLPTTTATAAEGTVEEQLL